MPLASPTASTNLEQPLERQITGKTSGQRRASGKRSAARRRLTGTAERNSSRRDTAVAHKPLDVLLDDLDYLHQHTGLDLLTPFDEVRDVHDQVVAVLNPLARRCIQRELEDEVAELQAELRQAQQEVSTSERRLSQTLNDLNQLEVFTSTLQLPDSVSTLSATSHPVSERQQVPSSSQGGHRDSTARSSSSSNSSSSSRAEDSRPSDHSQGCSHSGAAEASSSGSSSSEYEEHPGRQGLVNQTHLQRAGAGQGSTAGASSEGFSRPEQTRQRRPPEQSSMLSVRLDTPEQLRNFWYPAAFSGKLGRDQLMALELFGEQWVLFRDGQGRAACVVDECGHRACPLSLGSVVGGTVQCPYHGWRYDGSGACTAMPSTAFQPGVTIRALPTEEADGFVWVWPGEGTPPDAIPEFTRPPRGFQVHTELLLDVPVEHGLLLENLLDLAHAPFTHTTTFAKGWPIPDAVRFHTQRLLGGNWEPYPIDMSFEPPCGVLSTIGLAQPGRIERGMTAQQCTNHLHQLHVCIPAGATRTRLLYRMSMDFLGWTRAVPGIQRFWAHIAQQVMGEDLVLVAGQQDRVARGANAWAHPVAYDKLGIRYRRWRNALAAGSLREEASARDALSKKFTAGELFSLECPLGDDGQPEDTAITNLFC